MTDETSKRIQAEFGRQAGPMASAPAFYAQAVLQRFRQAVGHAPTDRVLDVACGPGIVAEALAPQVGEINGIDATPEMIRLARQRFEKAGLSNGAFEVTPAEHLPFDEGSFDQAVMRLALHHFEDVPAVLREAQRVLRPGGRLTIADIISVDDTGRAGRHNALEQLRDPTHVRFLAEAELVSLVGAAGFSVQQQDGWKQERSFDEWAAIIDDPARTRPLEQVMRALAEAGDECGMALREEGGKLAFTHTWLMVVASRT